MRDNAPRENREAPHGTGFVLAIIGWCIFGAGILVGALVF